MSDTYLFHRRSFLQTSVAGVAGLSLGSILSAQESKPVKLGEGKMTFTLNPNFGKLPAGMQYGFGCAVVVDSKDRVYVTSRSSNACVAVFDTEGKLLETWTKDFTAKIGLDPQKYAATAHGLYYSKEGGQEYFYWTENVAGKGDDRLGARVYKTDLTGKVLYTLGLVTKEDATSQKFDLTNPTDVAVAPNGDIYIVDGYGSQKVHRFDNKFKLIKTIGKPGKGKGEFNTCHGIWISTLKKEPEVYIADRANGRIEVYSLDLEYKRTLPGFRAPCCFYQHEGHLYVPELNARVTILDADDKIVTHLGDGEKVKAADRVKTPETFASPHALCTDSHGNLYVIEWVPDARIRQFQRTPA